MIERTLLLGATVSVRRNGAGFSQGITLSRSTETVAPAVEYLGEQA